MSMRRVVVTGLGVCSPLGSKVETVWQRLLAGEHGITKLTGQNFAKLPSRVAGLVPTGKGPNDFDPDTWFTKGKAREIILATAFALKAGDEALKMAKWLPAKQSPQDQFRSGVAVGTAVIDFEYVADSINALRSQGYSKLSPFFLPKIILNMAAGHVSIKYQLKGPNHVSTTACATGLHSVGDSFRWVREGDADVMLCGGTESPVNQLGVAFFSKMNALSTKYNDDPASASRPWDSSRDGFVLSEGCGLLVLEELEHAKKRGAKIYAEVLGYGQSGDGFEINKADPKGMGAFRAIRAAVRDARIDPKEISHVNCTANSLLDVDLSEMAGITKFFGTHTNNLMVTSTKGAHGHLIAGSGSLESIFAVLSAYHGVIPPTRNLQKLDPELQKLGALPQFVSGKSTEWKANRRVVLKNSFGYGGSNASLIFANYTE